MKDNHCQCRGKSHPYSFFVIRRWMWESCCKWCRTEELVWLFEIKLCSSHPVSFHYASIFMYVSLCIKIYCYPIAANRFSPPVQSLPQQRHIYLLKRCCDAIKPQSRVIILSDNCQQSPFRIVHAHPMYILCAV